MGVLQLQTSRDHNIREQAIPLHIRMEQVRLLYRNLQTSLYATLVASIIMIATLWGVISHSRLIGWASLIILTTLARFVLLSRFHRAVLDPGNTHLWYSRFLAGSIVAAIVWGLAGFLFMPAGLQGYQLLVVFVLGGIVAAASQSLAPVMTAYVSFCILVMLPAIVWLGLQQDSFHLSMSSLLVLFVAAMILLARYIHLSLRESFRLRFENADLINSLENEVGARKASEVYLQGQNRLLEMLATQHVFKDIFCAINEWIEKQLPDARSSILLLDKTGKQLQSISAPSLPDDYNDAINGAAIGPAAGSCGTAAYRNEMVIVEDIATDPLWADYKELAMAHGLKACWSIPVHDARARVVGTFALYYGEPRKPDTAEIELIQTSSRLAGIAIERRQAVEQLEHMAHYDALTSIPNRAMFMDRLRQAMIQAKRWKKTFALLFIDLDNFKLINDTLGHKAGDAVLQLIAKRLLESVRGVDTVARLGGDEFTVILSEVHDRKDTQAVAEKITASLGQPILLENRSYTIGGSIGICLYPDDGMGLDELINAADAAMYRAKGDGGYRHVFFSDMSGV